MGVVSDASPRPQPALPTVGTSTDAPSSSGDPPRRATRLGFRPDAPANATHFVAFNGLLLVCAVWALLPVFQHPNLVAAINPPLPARVLGTDFTWPAGASLLVLASLAVVLNFWNLQVPGYGPIPVADSFYLGVLVALGRPSTTLVVLLAGLAKWVRDRYQFRRNLLFSIYSVLHPVVSLGLGGWVFETVRNLPVASQSLWLQHPPGVSCSLLVLAGLELAAFITALTQAGCSAMAKVLHRDLTFYPQMIPTYRVRLYTLILAPLGLLTAVLLEAAPLGLVFLAFPVLVIYRTLKNYADVLFEARSTIEEMAIAVENRDRSMKEHSTRVALLAESVAREMRRPEEEVEAIVSAGKLHDLGKISIADCILLKESQLDEDEFEEMKRHPEVGGLVTGKFAVFNQHGNVSDMIRQHHEWYNGMGYPDQKKGEEILLGARILAAAEAWDSMTMHNAYRANLSFEAALIQLEEGAGTQFDPKVVEAMVRVLRRTREKKEGLG